VSAQAAAPAPFDLAGLKPGYRRRLGAIRAAGMLPVIDIESSYNPERIDLAAFTRAMDQAGIAQMALSVGLPGSLYRAGARWSDHAHELSARYPERFIPAGNGGVGPAWPRDAAALLDENERHIVAERYPLMGEFEFRHYPSPRQVERGEWDRDVNIPLDGPLGRRLFAFAEKTRVPFQIHYEVEDALLPALEAMLTRHPGAKVIWAHLAQVRYAERAGRYGPGYLRGLLGRHPNLYLDTAFGGPNSVYQPSGQRHARVWDERGEIRSEWRELVQDFPYRMLAALDIGGDRMDKVGENAKTLRRFLDRLPTPAQEIVAYKAAWRLLFGEDVAL
ncbi:MAG: amidohydrolase family protein, partial [Proteobacteria bacterium]|nr:amidohydrolase family protein [Pseudomonadota bacterium]